MPVFVLNNLHSDFNGYQQLITQYENNKESYFNKIEVRILTWFDAHLCTALGSILDLLKEKLNEIIVREINSSIVEALKKNDFLSYFSYTRQFDKYHTTIPYLKMKPEDGRYFFLYIKNELLNRSELPPLSSGLKEKIAEVIFEIFTNAQIHSGTKHIYACGQFFPRKNTIEFAIVDTGMGFKQRINSHFHINLSATKAIRWAFQDNTTTKDSISGGIGLSLLKEFIGFNNGEIQVVSNDGYYKFDSNGEKTDLFSGSFPGTIINMKFRTDDYSHYSLKEELNNDDIF